MKSPNGAFIDLFLCEFSLQETMFENLLFDDLDGIHVEDLNTQPSILLHQSNDERYVWKVEDEYVVGIEKIILD